jgi:hypothetical protein
LISILPCMPDSLNYHVKIQLKCKSNTFKRKIFLSLYYEPIQTKGGLPIDYLYSS